jgi:hypothetical protein
MSIIRLKLVAAGHILALLTNTQNTIVTLLAALHSLLLNSYSKHTALLQIEGCATSWLELVLPLRIQWLRVEAGIV